MRFSEIHHHQRMIPTVFADPLTFPPELTSKRLFALNTFFLPLEWTPQLQDIFSLLLLMIMWYVSNTLVFWGINIVAFSPQLSFLPFHSFIPLSAMF